jgi:hypothetical protein
VRLLTLTVPGSNETWVGDPRRVLALRETRIVVSIRSLGLGSPKHCIVPTYTGQCSKWKLPAYFVKVKQGYTVRKMGKSVYL